MDDLAPASGTIKLLAHVSSPPYLGTKKANPEGLASLDPVYDLLLCVSGFLHYIDH